MKKPFIIILILTGFCLQLAFSQVLQKENLPKVLIIGDSISIGYTPFVIDMLQDEAMVLHHEGNAQHTGTGLEMLDQWIGGTKWDVIHFNWGLWDLCYRHPDSKVYGNRDKINGTISIPLDQYEKNLNQLVLRLKMTGAKLIWAQTTVVPENEAGRKVGDDNKYNNAAEKIMNKHGVVINDLNILTKGFSPDLFASRGDVHYTKKGYQKIAVKVAEKISAMLKSYKPLTGENLAGTFLEIDPYAKTEMALAVCKEQLINVNPEALNILAKSTVNKMSSGLESFNINFMNTWAEGSGQNFMEWQLKVPESGEYDVTVLIDAKDCQLTIKTNKYYAPVHIQEEKWNRINLGTVNLDKGLNTLRLDIESSDMVWVSSLELVRPKIKKEMLADALSVRNSPDWFKDAGYGLMFQWTNRATPLDGPIKEWEQKVNDFDLNSMIDMVETTGASFVVWSVTWGQQYISAPIIALDQIIAGRTTKRDLLGEIADRLNQKGIRLIFYYHYGYDCYHSKDPDWMNAAGGYLADKTSLYENIIYIVTEIGQSYGNKLDGWFFDGGHRYYDTHFDGSEIVGMSSASFKEISLAARAGNKDRILCYNSWKLPRLTEYQDYFAGEGQVIHNNLTDGIFVDGPQEGLMAFGCFVLESRWGHIDQNKPIAPPKIDIDTLVKRIEYAKENRYPLAINLEMYEDGSVSSKSVELLKAVYNKVKK